MNEYHAEIICRAHFLADGLSPAKEITKEIAKDLASDMHVGLIYETEAGLTWQDHPRQTREESHPGSFTHLEMEAALCVWECINEWTLNTGRADWIELRDGVGSVEMRHQSIVLGQWVLKVYDICTVDDPDFFDAMPYDWEVVPMILDLARDGDGAPVIYEPALPDPCVTASKVKQIMAESEWRSSARQAAAKQWGYGNLIDDHPERTAAAYAAGEDPGEFVKLLGEKCDLTPA